MPCSDGGWSDEVRVSRDEVQEHTMLEAAMCGILTVLEKPDRGGSNLEGILRAVDWKEAGVKRKTLEIWWKKHKKQDAERRAREAAALNKEQLKASAISKLTAEERAALGLL